VRPIPENQRGVTIHGDERGTQPIGNCHADRATGRRDSALRFRPTNPRTRVGECAPHREEPPVRGDAGRHQPARPVREGPTAPRVAPATARPGPRRPESRNRSSAGGPMASVERWRWRPPPHTRRPSSGSTRTRPPRDPMPYERVPRPASRAPSPCAIRKGWDRLVASSARRRPAQNQRQQHRTEPSRQSLSQPNLPSR